MTATAVLPQNVKHSVVTILPADTSSLKTVLTAAGTFWHLLSLIATSDDTSDRLLQIWLTISGTDYLIGTVNVPTLSGTTATAPAINLLASANIQSAIYDAFGNRVLPIQTGILLKVKSTTTVTAAKTVTIYAVANES